MKKIPFHQNDIYQQDDSILPARCVWMAAGGSEQHGGTDNEKHESVKTGPAMWQNADHDEPVVVTGFAGEKDGRTYVYVEGSSAAIPLDEIKYTSTRKKVEDVTEKTSRKLEKKISSIRDKEKAEIASRLKESIDDGRVSNLEELRNETRREIFDLLGDEFESEDIKNEKILKKFTNDIVWRVRSILDDGDTIFNEITREHEQIKKCYSITRRLFNNEGYISFLSFLRNKKIGRGADAGTIPTNIDAIVKASKNSVFQKSTTADDSLNKNEYENFAAFSENAGYFLESITATERLYRTWETSYAEEKEDIEERIDTCEKSLRIIDADLNDNPDIRNAIPDIENNENKRDWEQIKAAYEDNFATAKGLMKGNPSDSDRKLAAALLQGNEGEIDGWLEAVQTAVEEKRAADRAIEQAEIDRKNAIEDAKENIDPRGVSSPAFTSDSEDSEKFSLHGRLSDLVTANGRIIWYSWHDFEKAFETIKQSAEAHIDQASGSKGGLLAMYPAKLMGKNVYTRWKILDNQGDRKRTDEIKPNLKNYSYDQLLADIGKRPKVGVDRRRAALEVLAERGNMRMSNPRLMEAIGAFGGEHGITKEEWEHAQQTADYAAIRVKFKHCIDGDYIGEPNYGEELLDKQSQGANHKEEFGKKLNDYAMAGTPSAEMSSIFHQVEEGYLEGDNIVVGQLGRSVERGNIWSGNGEFQTTYINGKEHQGGEKLTENASAGFAALKIIDGYLQGLIDTETINNISKRNESTGYNPLCCMQEMLLKRSTINEDGIKISKFEDWGWISGGRITKLGQSQIIRFFDTRTAEDAHKKKRHIAMDSGTYAEHSGRHNSINGFDGKVGDKMRAACLKAADGAEVYNAATAYNHEHGKLVSENREIAYLIRGATEEVQDAIEMKKDPRYSSNAPDDRQYKDNVDQRLDRGYRALTTMMDNMLKHTQDRALIRDKWDAYQILPKDEKTGLYKKRDKPLKKTERNDLRKFLETQLHELRDVDRSKYNDIMIAMSKLEDKSLVRPYDVWKKLDRNESDSAAREISSETA